MTVSEAVCHARLSRLELRTETGLDAQPLARCHRVLVGGEELEVPAVLLGLVGDAVLDVLHREVDGRVLEAVRQDGEDDAIEPEASRTRAMWT